MTELRTRKIEVTEDAEQLYTNLKETIRGLFMVSLINLEELIIINVWQTDKLVGCDMRCSTASCNRPWD